MIIREYNDVYPFTLHHARKLSGKIATVKYRTNDGEVQITGIVKPLTRTTMYVGDVVLYYRAVMQVQSRGEQK